MNIAVVAPGNPLKPEAADAAIAAAERIGAKLKIHPQCFATCGHFAGPDMQRLAALREAMADPEVDAVWFAHGGYGANRIAEAAAKDLPDAARHKLYLGYSDAGFLLAAFDRAGLDVAHGPMPRDALRADGLEAIERALAWIVKRDPRALEPGLDGGRAMAFNLTVLSNLLGTAIEPDFTGADLLIEDLAEHDYRIDRTMFHVTGHQSVRACRQIRLGRISDIPDNDPPFGSGPDTIVPDWCARAGIAFGGTADIGHDAMNRVVPFRSRAR